MKRLPTLTLLAALLSSPAFAQSSGSGASVAPSRAQAERNAVELKQGMKLEEVQQLLGKPQRTALRSNGSAANVPWQGTMQWTYTWGSAASSSSSAYSASSDRVLNIEFAAKNPAEWYVNGWGWTNY